MEELNFIYNNALKIYESNTLTFEEKYHLIFSDDISLKTNFDWYDPDTSYEDDVNAYMSAFTEFMEK